MAFAYIGSAKNDYGDYEVTTPGFDTTGADLLIVGVTGTPVGGSLTISDNKSNSWTLAVSSITYNGLEVFLW